MSKKQVFEDGLNRIGEITAMLSSGEVSLEESVELYKEAADIAAALTAEAQLGIKKAFDPKLHAVRGQSGQIKTAANLLRLLEGSSLAADLQPDKVQDAYTVRCTPQIHGASRDAIDYVWNVVSREINAVTDNPIIFPDEDEAISGGNFHGQPRNTRTCPSGASNAS